MFITLLLVNLTASLLVCLATVLIFRSPLVKLVKSHFAEEAAAVWIKFILFTIFVIGISVGTRLWDIEKYIDPQTGGTINQDLLALEIYKTVIATMQVNAVLFFVLLAVVGIVYLAKKKS
jgi:hypothetical protein